MKNKKKVLILIILVLVVVIIGVLLLFSQKDKKVQKKKSWKDILLNEAKDGTLQSTIKKELKKKKIDTNEVESLLLDIDSDKNYELVVYTDNNLFTFHINEKVEADRNYEIHDKSSLKTAYNRKSEEVYWYIDNEDKVVITDEDKSYSSDDFLAEYYELVNEYNNKMVLDSTTTINLDKKDISPAISKTIKVSFSNEELLENNDLTIDKIKEKIQEDNSRKNEVIQEEKKDEEIIKEDTSTQSNSNSVVEKVPFKYGNYYIQFSDGSLATDGSGTVTLNQDGSCNYYEGWSDFGCSSYYVLGNSVCLKTSEKSEDTCFSIGDDTLTFNGSVYKYSG